MKTLIIDAEGNGLKPDKFYCISYVDVEGSFEDVKSCTDYKDMIQVLTECDTIIGHNFSQWDAPNLERVLGIEIKATIIDTLALSWYLFPTLRKHGLEEWGESFGIPKPYIEDWHSLTIQEYINRCQEDVKINLRLWKKIEAYLQVLYNNQEEIDHLVRYLSFKMYCTKLASESKWKIDLDQVNKNLDKLRKEQSQRYETLKQALPATPVYSSRKKPSKKERKDGTLSSKWVQWVDLCKEQRVDPDTTEEVKVVIRFNEPNPNSHPQLKDWLFSLGWSPDTFKFDKDDKGKERKIPQISDLEDKSELSPSVKSLIKDHPEVEALEGLFLLNHRISILEGFKEFAEENDGYILAECAGFTNTLRLRHKTAVNLPGVDRPYGKEIREVLIAEEGWELCGSDMQSLEDRTKQHYIYFYDPRYVEEMNTEGFDPHLDIAELAGMMTHEEVVAYKEGDHKLKPVRHKAKTTNYACTYGAFPPKIAQTADIPLKEAQKLWDTYWERNKAVKQVAETCKVKEIEDQKWLWNPVARIWYSLKYEKDRFSTLNQGTGSYCFDTWLAFILQKRPQITAQFHDEVILMTKKGYREQIKEILNNAIEKTNKALKLNRELGIDIQFGDCYAEIH